MNAIDSLCNRAPGRDCIFISDVMLQFRQSSCLERFIFEESEIDRVEKKFIMSAVTTMSGSAGGRVIC